MFTSTLIAAAMSYALVAGGGLPIVAPGSVGMSAARLAKIGHVVERGISAGGYPGAAVVVGRKGFAVMEQGYGRIDWSAQSAPVVAERTIYDLASLTKVIGTTTAIMVLYDEGKVGLDDPVSKFVPEFTGGGKENVTVRMLLEHRSGLPAGRELWRTAHSPAEARAQVIATPLGCAPGRCYEYSDLGADMLGFIVEAASGMPLDQFLNDRVFRPLGMTDTFFKPADSLRDRIAPTEVSPPRGYPLQGEVHDENAYALGGVAGHAGLFSTASDLSVFAQMMLNGGEYNGVRIVADSTVKLFTARVAGTKRALGWDTCTGEGGCGEYLSDRAYGHTGFTGTSIWIDPEREMFVVLLTNRVHEARARRPARVIADVRADLADASALAVEDYGDGPMAMPESFRADREVDWNRPLRHVRVRRHVVHPHKAAKKSASHAKGEKSKASGKHASSSGKHAASHAKASKSGASKSSAKRSAR
ncbi:MAG TPA: serine hydrolase [Gemmatimonadaceae bacterium]|nr:serine hydrolase [Gemmatimonadaceae bacterium]